jgi:hypothetical protein
LRNLLVREKAEPPLDAVGDAELAREAPQRLDGVEGIAGDHEPRTRKLAQRAQQHVEALVLADQAEEEDRRALRRLRLDAALEDRVLDPHQPLPLHAQVRQLLERALRLDDHAVDERERLAPGAGVLLPPRQDVVRGQHRRRPEAPQPVDVVARDPEPLHVRDVRVEHSHAANEAHGARWILEPLRRQPQTRARRAAHEP